MTLDEDGADQRATTSSEFEARQKKRHDDVTHDDIPYDDSPLATLVRLTKEGDADGVDKLLKARAHLERVGVALCIDCLDLKSGLAAIHIAAGFGFDGVVKRLLANGASAAQLTSTGVTALHCAVTHCRSTAVLDTLLAAGTPIDARDALHGLTALMMAAQRGLPRCVAYLIEAGARTELTLPQHNERRGSGHVDARGLAAANGHGEVEAVFAALVGAAPPKAGARTHGRPLSPFRRLFAALPHGGT
jgi:ankyrin repeat protein